jgi:ribosome-associated protein
MQQRSEKVSDVYIHHTPIELSQFLKLAQVVASGGEAKVLIQEGEVRVNGEQETKRSRHLNNGDTVAITGVGVFRVAITNKKARQ